MPMLRKRTLGPLPGLMENWAQETDGNFAMSHFDGGYFYFAEDGGEKLGQQLTLDLSAILTGGAVPTPNLEKAIQKQEIVI